MYIFIRILGIHISNILLISYKLLCYIIYIRVSYTGYWYNKIIL